MRYSDDQLIRSDCRFFVGDRPCRFHKQEGVKCDRCSYYERPTTRVLIVKLGAMGDVLRTTSLLPSLHAHWHHPHVSWLTSPESIPLLLHQPLIDTPLAVGAESLARLHVETFDLVINPEASKESSALATLANGRERRGFGLSSAGVVQPLNAGSEELFVMGLLDDVKKRNLKTYEQLICQVADLPYRRSRPSLHLTVAERAFVRKFSMAAGLHNDRPLVGINTGGGGRWRHKRWTVSGFQQLARRLHQRHQAQVLLLGGPDEEVLNRLLLEQLGSIAVDGGAHNTVREFAALIGRCDVVVTGDSLALHLGLALGRRIVALFGPTSVSEIDLYGLGRKMTADLDCLCCYREDCEEQPNCMESIDPETVADAVAQELEQSAGGQR